MSLICSPSFPRGVASGGLHLFSKETPPTALSICQGHFARVRPVYSSPVRCFNCQQYGHSRTNCRRRHVVCRRCGSAASDTRDPHTCARDEHCFHCKGSHQASLSACPRYQEEKLILIIHHKDNVPLPIACQLLATEREHRT